MMANSEKSSAIVKLEKNRNKLCLRVPLSVSEVIGKRRIYLGLDDTKENREIAERKRIILENDILNEDIDLSLKRYMNGLLIKYKKASLQTKGMYKSLKPLMKEWMAYKKENVSPKTFHFYVQHYDTIMQSDILEIKKSELLVQWLLNNKPPYFGKRIMQTISSACDYAVERGKLSDNPFKGKAKLFKPKKKALEDEIDPFTLEEQKIIINAFEEHSLYSRYANFVKFLFWTGCRPSEAIGLKWANVDINKERILFCESISSIGGRPVINDSTKTNKDRYFHVNKQLMTIIKEQEKKRKNDVPYVFTHNGSYIRYESFYKMAWYKDLTHNGIIIQLVEDGKIDRYRSPYQCRHTFGTLLHQRGYPIADIAKLLGNSVEICLRHYVHGSKKIEAPEF